MHELTMDNGRARAACRRADDCRLPAGHGGPCRTDEADA